MATQEGCSLSQESLLTSAPWLAEVNLQDTNRHQVITSRDKLTHYTVDDSLQQVHHLAPNGQLLKKSHHFLI